MSHVTVRIENCYADGHQSTCKEQVPPPTSADLDDWWQEIIVFPYTGDGHGIAGLTAVHIATVIAAEREDLIGKTCEWAG